MSPSHTYGSAGTHDVTLTVTDNDANTSVLTRKVTSTDTGLVARFRTKKSDEENLKIFFNGEYSHDAAGADVANLHWDFGDGTYYDEGTPMSGDYGWLLVDNASRLIDWTYCGIPGGIPNRATIYTSLGVAGQAKTYVQSVTSTQINSALSACPSGQVVKLNAGTYNLSGSINGKSNMTLRGAGANQTIINSSVSGECLSVEAMWSYTSVAMSSGYTKGSTSVVVSSASNFQTGNLIVFDENDDVPDLGVMSSDGPGRKLRTLGRITGISGTTISFTPPLPYTLKSSLSPKAGYLDYGLSPTVLFGIEDLTLNSTGGANIVLQLYGTDRCWMKSVEYSGGSNIQVWLGNSLQFEMRHCYSHDVAGAPANGEGYGIYLYDSSSYCRVEDNIFYTMAAGILCSQTSANALLYNYAWKTTFNSVPYQFCMLNCNHGAYGLMSLWEGNLAEQWQNDGYHGTCGYQTLFRNWIHGLHPTSITNRKMIDLDSGSYYHNVVGNVLGDASWVPVSYEMTGQPDYAAQPCIYRLGYPNMTNNDLDNNNWTARYGVTAPDAKVRSTLLRHGNYDYKNNAVVWDGGITSHSIPASLIYASKPSYFGSLQWPPIGPDVTGFHTDTPSHARWKAYQISGNKDDLF